ncbi:hypothetical protein AB0K08_12550, partial [Citricoccus sp. NPDC055426]|uniref:hypothetical protein n=1 Tax=Citricoccus sp. NPDC055426 TaxID=3155536 RepID=UPI00341CADD8
MIKAFNRAVAIGILVWGVIYAPSPEWTPKGTLFEDGAGSFDGLRAGMVGEPHRTSGGFAERDDRSLVPFLG